MKKISHIAADVLLVTGAIGVAMLLVMIGLWIAGYPAGRVLAQWFAGAVGSHFAFIVATKNACPLILTGLAAGIAFRSGVINIGAEGQSILGAIATVIVATRLFPAVAPTWMTIPLALAGAMCFGGLWAMVAGAMERYRGVPIVLSTILLNFIALQLLSLLLEGPLKAAHTEVVQSDALPAAYWLPVFSSLGGLRAGVFIALFAATVAWVLQARTAFGFELLVTGLNPTAAQTRGHAHRPAPTRCDGIVRRFRRPRWRYSSDGRRGALSLADARILRICRHRRRAPRPPPPGGNCLGRSVLRFPRSRRHDR